MMFGTFIVGMSMLGIPVTPAPPALDNPIYVLAEHRPMRSGALKFYFCWYGTCRQADNLLPYFGFERPRTPEAWSYGEMAHEVLKPTVAWLNVIADATATWNRYLDFSEPEIVFHQYGQCSQKPPVVAHVDADRVVYIDLWANGPDRSAQDYLRWKSNLVHEFGHVLGVPHSALPSDVMYPSNEYNLQEPSQGDIDIARDGGRPCEIWQCK